MQRITKSSVYSRSQNCIFFSFISWTLIAILTKRNSCLPSKVSGVPAKLILLSSVSSAPETTKQHAKQQDTPLRGSKHTHCFKINLGYYNLSKICSFLFHRVQRFQKVGGFLKQSGDFETLLQRSFVTQICAVAKTHTGVGVEQCYLKNEFTET